MMNRRRRASGRRQHGFVLIALTALLVMAGLYFFLANLSPGEVEARRQQKTEAALVQARDALIGYALQYRERLAAQDANFTGDDDSAMYGHLPLPDFGESLNLNGNLANQICTSEGCAKINPSGIGASVGRFPWKTLGTEPLRDGHGECLWYAVATTHRALSSTATTMNWDTLAVPDLVIGSGLATLAAVNEHERPLAVIFAAGPAFDNGRTASLDAPECGGNYDVTHYVNAALNNAQRSLPVTSERLFGAIRKNAYFRTDINAMLDRMAACLRDQLAAETAFTPIALSGFTPAPGFDKSVGRLPSHSCYDDAQNPLGYFAHYRDQVFIARPTSGTLEVAVDGADRTACSAALIFANQRGAGQLRTTAAERDTPANYLEGGNLAGFTGNAEPDFAGPSLFARVSAAQTASQDIVRCIPAGPSLTTVPSPALASAGFSQLAAYDPGTQTLSLGALGVTPTNGAPAHALYGCSWTPETHVTGSGLRAYFRFRIVDRGDGFVFALIDGDRNSANVCGAARQHLGYSGNNDPDQSSNGLLPAIVGNETAIIDYPKIGIEFDNTKATGTITTSGNPLTAGRNDPDYTPPQDNDAHAAIVYWGGNAAIATGTPCNASAQCPYTGSCGTFGNCPAVRYCNTADHMCYLRPEYDDNVHGFPSPPDTSTRPSPRNPPAVDPFPSPVYSPAPGLASLDRLGNTTASKRDFHVRVELTRTYAGFPIDASERKGTYKLETWIAAEGIDTRQIAAIKNTTRPMSELYSGFPATLSNSGIRYDEPQGACTAGVCAAGQTCAADNICYRTGPPTIDDLPLGACNAERECSGPPLLKHNSCAADKVCPRGQSCGADNFCYDALYSCGSDNICYGEAFRSLRLGFTNGQGTQDQLITISGFVATWLP